MLIKGKIQICKDIYEAIATEIRKYWRKTYYGDVLISFELSYDGVNWDYNVVYVHEEDGDIVIFSDDFYEGQQYLQSFRIWHLEDSVEKEQKNEYLGRPH